MSKTSSSRSAKSNYVKRAVTRYLNEIALTCNTEIDSQIACNNKVSSFQYIYNKDTLQSGSYTLNDQSVKYQTHSGDNININSSDTITLFDDTSIYGHNQSSNQFLLGLSGNNFDRDDENIFEHTSDDIGYYPTCSSSEDDSKEEVLGELLVKWSIRHNITHSSFSDLLKILSKYHDLPKDARTLLKSKSCFSIIVIKDMYGEEAEYVYLGIKSKLASLLAVHAVVTG